MTPNAQALQDQISRFPEEPGVYLMKDAEGNIIYIGKAVNLKSRVRSYFSDTHDGRPQIPLMMRRLDSIDLIVTGSETEALVLEAELVRKHLPKYNVELRDDKRYPYLKITAGEAFPRLLVARRAEGDEKKGGALYFGPFTDVTVMRRMADFARRVFKIRTCAKRLPLKKPVRPCINRSMKRCDGPCGVECGGEGYRRALDDYRRNVDDLVMFLKGRRGDLVRELEERMSKAASELRFEDAATYRNQIRLIKSSSRLRRPDLKVAGAEENAQPYLSLQSPVVRITTDQEALTELQKALNLPILPRVIEAFDISNLGGSFTVAGMARFVDGRPDRAGYRRFKIKTVEGQNDFAMMMEAVGRRLRRLSDEGRPFPDLLLIDGGKGQLHAAMEALKNFDNPPLIASLAKKEEILFSPCASEPLALPPTHPARKLVERVRDEVHRCAITYHRKIRGKQFKRSALEDMPGIGKNRAALLIKKFGSIKRLRDAPVEEIAAVKGFSEKSAAKLKIAIADAMPN